MKARISTVGATVCLLAALAVTPPPLRAAANLIGALNVTTQPAGAAVYVNGELQGAAPCDIRRVAIGEVEVRAVLQGYESASETVQVVGDETASVELTLAPLENVGSIAVRVDPPGALVELDRVPVGASPTVVPNVPAGTHRVVVSAPGFRPLYTTVTVARNLQFELKGALEPIEEAARAATGIDMESLGILDVDKIPFPDDLPEEQAFKDVRDLIGKRRYDDALGLLDAMAAEPQAQQYTLRIGRERRFIRRLQDLTARAHSQLKLAEGQEYVLQLRHGVRLAGRVTRVTDENVYVILGGAERDIPVRNVSAEQIIRLAERTGGAATQPADRITFALLHAAEGEFDQAYEHLRTAAEQGADITAALLHVDAEHLWAAALQKAAADAHRARTAEILPGRPLPTTSLPVPVFVDTHRGRRLPEAVSALLEGQGFTVGVIDRPFGAEDARRPGVLVIADAGAGRPLPDFDRQEVQRIVDMVQRGGGLVFFGTSRPVSNRPHPYAPLLRWFGIQVCTGRLSLSDEAPRDYPKDWALAYPSLAHATTQRVRRAVFPIESPSLALEDASWGIMRTPPFLGSRRAGEAGPALVGARTFGLGRVVVFADQPQTSRTPDGPRLPSPNDSDRLLADALAWVSAPARIHGADTR